MSGMGVIKMDIIAWMILAINSMFTKAATKVIGMTITAIIMFIRYTIIPIMIARAKMSHHLPETKALALARASKPN